MTRLVLGKAPEKLPCEWNGDPDKARPPIGPCNDPPAALITLCRRRSPQASNRKGVKDVRWWLSEAVC